MANGSRAGLCCLWLVWTFREALSWRFSSYVDCRHLRDHRRRRSRHTYIGLLGVNLWPLFIQECSSTLTTYNLYTPYGSVLPTYWYAVTPQIQPNVGVSNVYYHVIPYAASLSPVSAATAAATVDSAAVEQQRPRMMTNIKPYAPYQRRPIDEFDESLAEEPSCSVWSWPDNVCDDDGNYPVELIHHILEENFNVIPKRQLVPTDSSISIRDIDDNDHHGGTCDAETRVIYPRVVRSIDNKWVYVANYKDYSQPVRIMKCSSFAGSCSPAAGSQSTYGSKCQQSTRRLTMVAIDVKRRKPYKETFEMPVECRCNVFSSVFPTRSNRPGSHPAFPLVQPPHGLPASSMFPNHVNVTEDLANLGLNQVSRRFEERVRRRH